MPRKPQFVQIRLPKTADLTGIDRILAGMALILQYEPTAEFNVAHDQIYLGVYDPERMTLEERGLMEAWGWIESEDSWSHFV